MYKYTAVLLALTAVATAQLPAVPSCSVGFPPSPSLLLPLLQSSFS